MKQTANTSTRNPDEGVKKRKESGKLDKYREEQKEVNTKFSCEIADLTERLGNAERILATAVNAINRFKNAPFSKEFQVDLDKLRGVKSASR